MLTEFEEKSSDGSPSFQVHVLLIVHFFGFTDKDTFLSKEAAGGNLENLVGVCRQNKSVDGNETIDQTSTKCELSGGSWRIAQSSWLMAHGPRLMACGSRLMALGS